MKRQSFGSLPFEVFLFICAGPKVADRGCTLRRVRFFIMGPRHFLGGNLLCECHCDKTKKQRAPLILNTLAASKTNAAGPLVARRPNTLDAALSALTVEGKNSVLPENVFFVLGNDLVGHEPPSSVRPFEQNPSSLLPLDPSPPDAPQAAARRSRSPCRSASSYNGWVKRKILVKESSTKRGRLRDMRGRTARDEFGLCCEAFRCAFFS